MQRKRERCKRTRECVIVCERVRVCVCVYVFEKERERFLTAEDPLLFHISPSVTNAWLYSVTHTDKHTHTYTRTAAFTCTRMLNLLPIQSRFSGYAGLADTLTHDSKSVHTLPFFLSLCMYVRFSVCVRARSCGQRAICRLSPDQEASCLDSQPRRNTQMQRETF